MVYNILNGDSLAYSFPDTKIEGDVIVVREGLIDGDLSGDNLHDFWQSRAKYMGLTEAEYHNNVVKEFEKIMDASDSSEFNLWFEYDLFCQVNMWFTISIINSLPIKKKVYAVYTSYLDRTDKQFWGGFGPANSSELASCFANRIPFKDADLKLGQDLWTTYKSENLQELIRLARSHQAIRFLIHIKIDEIAFSFLHRTCLFFKRNQNVFFHSPVHKSTDLVGVIHS